MAGTGPQPVIVHTHLMVWQRYVPRAASAVKRASRYIIDICDTLFLMNTYTRRCAIRNYNGCGHVANLINAHNSSFGFFKYIMQQKN